MRIACMENLNLIPSDPSTAPFERTNKRHSKLKTLRKKTMLVKKAYKRLAMKTRQSREKTMLARKGFIDFIDIVGGNGQKKKDGESKKKEPKVSPCMGNNDSPSSHKSNTVEENARKPKEKVGTSKNNLARRKRVRWTTEEEDILKEGVQKFSIAANKNLPWRKILEFGHHVFNETRTPVDLKDKWKNIMAKQSNH